MKQARSIAPRAIFHASALGTFIWIHVRQRRRVQHSFVMAAILGIALLAASPTEGQTPGVLTASPTSLVFSGVEGETCTAVQTINVVASSDAPLQWQATTSVPWLQVGDVDGVTPAQIASSVDCAGLPAGVHNATLTVSSPAAPNSPQLVDVAVIINPNTPVRLSTWKDGHRGAFSVSTDDSHASGFSELVSNGLTGTFVMNGTVPPFYYHDMFAEGMELGAHLVSHYCHEVDEETLRFEIEANVDGVTAVTESLDEVISMVWPCGLTNPRYQVIAAEYFLSSRGYNMNQLEDATPSNFMNLKSFNSHEHVPFPPGDLRSIVDGAVAQRKWANLVLHEFTNDDGAIAYSKTRDVWVAPIGTVIKYIAQRDRTIVSGYGQSSSAISFTFSRLPLSPTIRRNFEASIKPSDLVTFQVDISSVPYVSGVTVSGTSLPFEVREEAGTRYLYFSTPVTTTPQLAQLTITSVVPPILTVSSDHVEMTVNQGDPGPSEILTIANGGGGTLTWSATVDGEEPNWLSLSAASGGNGPSAISAGVAAAMAVGTHTRTVTFTAPGAVNSPRTVSVTVHVFPSGTNHYAMDYADRASLLADGWDFLARTSAGGIRDTEQTSGAIVEYGAAGVLRVPVDTGDLWELQNDTRNSLFRDLPPDWASVRVRLNFMPFQDTQQAALVIYQDDDNYVQVTRLFGGGQFVVFEREQDGDPAVLNLDSFGGGGDVYLRLDRHLGTGIITGLYSLDGIAWQTLGTTSQTLSNARLGLIVGGSPGGFPLASFHTVLVMPNTTPVLTVDASSLAFVANVDSPTSNQTVSVANGGGGSLSWTTTIGGGGPNWLTVTPASGSGSAAIAVSVHTTGLAPGTYRKTLTVAAPLALESPRTIPVTLTVFPNGTQHFLLDYPDRASLLADGWDFLARTASGGIRDTEQVSGAVVGYDPSGVLRIPADVGDLWESLNDTRNSLFRDLPGNWSSVRVRLDFAPFQSPQQAGIVVYDHDDNYVHVTRIYNGGAQLVTFAHEVGGAAAVLGSVGEPATQNLFLRLDRNSLTGTITGLYSLDSETWQLIGSVDQPLSVPRLGIIVGASAGGFPEAVIHEVQVYTNTTPTLALSSTALAFAANEGEQAPAHIISIENSGGGLLTWSAAVNGDGPAWLSVSSASGVAPGTIQVSADATGLAAGTYSRTITVVSAEAVNSPRTITVTLNVLPAGSEVHVLSYPDRSTLLAAGWDFLARTSAGSIRDTEQTSGAVVSYDAAGALQIPADVGDLWEGMNDTRNSLFRDLPPDWASVRVQLDFAPFQTPQQAGIVIYDNDDDYVHVTRIFNGSHLIVLARETGGTAAVLEGAAVTATDGLFLRLDRDVATGVISAFYSLDGGESWQLLGGIAKTFSSPRLGLIAGASYSGFPIARFRVAQVVPNTIPVLTVSAESLSFSTAEGETPAGQQFAVTNAGGGTLTWTATVEGSGANWLSVSPPSGTGSGVVGVNVNVAGLTAGTYVRTVVIDAPGAVGGQKTVPVTLTVLPAGTQQYGFDYPDRASLLADGWDFLARSSNGALRDTEQTSGAVVTYSPSSGTVRIPADVGDLWEGLNDTRNSLFRDLPANWDSVQVRLDFAPFQPPQQAGIVVYQDDDNYVHVTRIAVAEQAIVFARETGAAAAVLSSAPVTATTNLFLRMDRDIALGVVTGLYSLDGVTWHFLGSVAQALNNPRLGIIVGASYGGFPEAVIHDVLVSVSTTPALTLSDASLAFVVNEGESASVQELHLSNGGGGALTWTATVTGDGPDWLSVNPTAGTGSGTLSVNVNIMGLTQGVYARTIAIAAPGALGSPKSVPVTLTVLPHGTVHYAFDYADRSSLLAAGWDFLARTATGTARNTEQTSGAVVSYDPSGGLRIPADLGDLWEGMNDTRNSLFRDLPANWASVRLRLSFAPFQAPQQAGLVVYDDDDNYVQVTRIFANGQSMVLARETGGVAAVLASHPVEATNNLFLRLDRNSSTDMITGSYSLDGMNWQPLASITQPFSNPRFGIIVAASPGGFPEATIHEAYVLTSP